MVHPQVSADNLKFLGLWTLQWRCLSPNVKLELLTRHCLSLVTFHEACTRISQTSRHSETTGCKAMLCALNFYCKVRLRSQKRFRITLWRGRNNHRLSFTKELERWILTWTHRHPRQNKNKTYTTPDFHDKPFSEGQKKGEGTREQKDCFGGKKVQSSINHLCSPWQTLRLLI